MVVRLGDRASERILRSIVAVQSGRTILRIRVVEPLHANELVLTSYRRGFGIGWYVPQLRPCLHRLVDLLVFRGLTGGGLREVVVLLVRGIDVEHSMFVSRCRRRHAFWFCRYLGERWCGLVDCWHVLFRVVTSPKAFLFFLVIVGFVVRSVSAFLFPLLLLLLLSEGDCDGLVAMVSRVKSESFSCVRGRDVHGDGHLSSIPFFKQCCRGPLLSVRRRALFVQHG